MASPGHPGYAEATLVSGSRVFASGAIFAALALALGGGHLAIAAIAAFPFLSRLAHFAVPAFLRRFGSWPLAAASAWLERIGLFAAALVGIVRPEGWALEGFLGGLALALLGQAIYDVAMASLHSEASEPEGFGRYTALKTRWAAISGLVLGVVASFAVDATESLGVPPHIARSLAILVGVAIHFFASRQLARMDGLARSIAALRATRTRARSLSPDVAHSLAGHCAPPGASGSDAHSPGASPATAPGSDAHSPATAPATAPAAPTLPSRTTTPWGIVRFALAWGFALGISTRQGEAMAISVLHLSVGTLTLLNALLVGGGVLGAKTWGLLADRFGGKGLMSIALVALALDPLWLLGALTIHPLLLVPGYVLYGVFNSGWNIATNITLVRTAGAPAERIRSLVVYNIAFGLAAGTAPLLGGLLLGLVEARFDTGIAYASLFALAATLRLSAYPLLRLMPAPPARRGRYVSAVVMRVMRRNASRGRLSRPIGAEDKVASGQSSAEGQPTDDRRDVA